MRLVWVVHHPRKFLVGASSLLGLGEVGDHVLVGFERDNLKGTAFSLLVGATVAIMSVSGGTQGLVNVLFACDQPKAGMLATWAAGLACSLTIMRTA